MTAFGRFPRRFRLPWRDREQIHAEVDEEIAFHLTMRAEELIAGGLEPAAAEAQAVREFGDPSQARAVLGRDDQELESRRRRVEWLYGLTSDLRLAARSLLRAPTFTASVVLVLALGVGTTTAMFSLLNGILLDPLPYPESDRLVRVTHTVSDAGAAVDLSDAMVMLYQSETRAFAGVAAWRFDDGDLGPTEAAHTPVRVRGARVTANFFDVLGVPPALGRTFEAGEDRPGKNGVVVLSHRIWRERLRGDPDVLGREIEVNDVPRTIVGVMPPSFAYPASEVELWLPLSIDPARTRPASVNLVGIARLGRDMPVDAARADLARVLPNLGDYIRGEDYSATRRQTRVTPHVQSLRDSIVGPVSHLLWFVFGSGLLVLLVACTNVASLFLIRGERVQVELAVRAALGSGLMGMLARTLSEAVVLSLLGGAAGLLLATAAMKLVLSTGTALSLPRLENVGVDAQVLLFALGVTVFCALFVSLLPLLRARRISISQVLRRAPNGPVAGRAPQRLRNALVVSQIALAVVLVTLSGLMTRSLLRLYDVRPGFGAEQVVTARVLLPYVRYGAGETRLGFFQDLVREVEAIPGTREVGLTDWVPLSGESHAMAIDVEGDLSEPGPGGSEHGVAHVDGEYFQALRIPLLRGRSFGPQDAARPAEEAIVSRAFAERYWSGASPLGKRVRPLGGPWYTIVGEVGDVHYVGLDEPPDQTVYFPILVAGQRQREASLPPALSVVVRTDAGEGETLSAIRRIVAALDPTIPTYDEGSLERLVHDASARTRALVVLLAIGSVVTMLLGAVGLYGVMAYGVGVRRRELGIRMALGARPVDVRWMVSLDGLRLAGMGIVIGTACALAVSRILRGLLYGVSPTDLVTLTATTAALLVVALVASWLPAHRAAAVNPAEALRAW